MEQEVEESRLNMGSSGFDFRQIWNCNPTPVESVVVGFTCGFDPIIVPSNATFKKQSGKLIIPLNQSEEAVEGLNQEHMSKIKEYGVVRYS